MSSFTGIAHQGGRFNADHTFRGGLKADFAPEATPNLVYTSAGNMHLVRQLGSEIILASDRGTERRCRLPDNHVVIGHNTRDSILYLVLAEVLNGATTGRGEIGTYPAPDYAYVADVLTTEGSFTDAYQPLHVFVNAAVSPRVGPLTSVLFNFDLNAPVEVHLQPSYDGSVNLLVNDRGQHAPLLINSGFTRNGATGYKLLERTGAVVTNRYTPADFAGRLQQQLRSQTAAKLDLFAVQDGGELLGGDYTYYLQYADADGNVTGVAAEIGPVAIFDQRGSVPAFTVGVLPGAKSNRRVVLHASGLDTQLGYVRLSYVRRAGEPTAAISSNRLGERFVVPPSGELEILHSGLEQEFALPVEELLPLSNRVEKYVTAAPADQGRLIVGGVKMNAGLTGTLALLRAYAQTCKLGHDYIELEEPGLKLPNSTSGQPTNYYQSFSQRQPAAGGWEGGYANPINICYRLGVHDGEAYGYGLQAQLLDGTITDVFTLLGLDNLDGQASYDANATYDELGWTADNKQNRAGVYRFPRTAGTNRMLLGAVGSGQTFTKNVTVLHATLQLPAMPAALQALVKAIRIVRAPRRPNRMMQGYLLPCLKALASPPGGDQTYDHHHTDMRNILEYGTTDNMKVLPAPVLALEGAYRCDDDSRNIVRGVYPFTFSRQTNFPGRGNVNIYDPLRFGLYAPELWANAATLRQTLANAAAVIVPVGVVSARKQIKHSNYNGGNSFGLYQTTEILNLPAQTARPARLLWVNAGQEAVNPGRFGSREYKLRGKRDNNQKVQIELDWDEYVGVVLETPIDPNGSLLNLGTAPKTGYETFSLSVTGEVSKAALLVNVYGAGGVWDGDALRAAYSSDSVAYAPVTHWLTQTELEGQLDANRQLPLFGGDCYVSTSVRRFTHAMQTPPGGEANDAQGQAIALITSSTVNPWTRTPDGVNKQFSPYVGAADGQFDAFREPAYRAENETTRYNNGYAPPLRESPPSVVSVKENAALLPYTRYTFPQRVWASGASADTAITNGWRFFPPLLFRDYDIGGGDLVRILAGPSGQMLLVYERALASIQLNEKALLGGSGADAIYTAARELLPPRARVIATDLGCQHAFGICQSDDAAYGFDAMQSVMWKYEWGSGKAKRLSDQNISTLLAPAAAALVGQPVRLLTRDVRLAFDPKRGDVVLSIYQNTPSV